ncbi:hypothetical protein DFJ77DRAFT_194349 [Powellomyces hirtus]|nr:hypothetical protein DFJ77DRAFT_194349 [Powellomyces hirtus]
MFSRTPSQLLSSSANAAPLLRYTPPTCRLRLSTQRFFPHGIRDYQANSVLFESPKVNRSANPLTMIFERAKGKNSAKKSKTTIYVSADSTSQDLITLIRSGNARQAHNLFVQLDYKNDLQPLGIAEYNALFRLMRRHPIPQHKKTTAETRVVTAEKIWQAMVRNGVRPNSSTYVAMATAYAMNGQVKEVDDILAQVAAKGWRLSHGQEIRLLALSSMQPDTSLAELRTVLENNPEKAKEVASVYNKLLQSYSTAFDDAGFTATLKLGQEFSIPPDGATYDNLIFHFAINKRQMDEARAMMEQRAENGYGRTTRGYNTLLRGYLKDQNVKGVHKTFSEMTENGVPMNEATYNCLLALSAMRKDALGAMTTYLKLRAFQGNAPNYGSRAVLARAVQHYRGEIFQLVIKAGGQPSEHIYRTLIIGASDDDLPDVALRFIQEYRKHHAMNPGRFRLSQIILTLELACICRKNNVAEAETFFEQHFANSPCGPYGYNGMIMMYKRAQLPEKALEMYEHMLRYGLKPNMFTFGSLIESSWNFAPHLTPLTIRYLRVMAAGGLDMSEVSYDQSEAVYLAFQIVGHGDFHKGVQRIESGEEIDVESLPPYTRPGAAGNESEKSTEGSSRSIAGDAEINVE